MPWENSRPTHVPTKVRQACLTRDGNRCTVTLQAGGRCTETTNLEAAHIGRWSPDENTTVDDVTTKCHWHHNRETMQQAADARKQSGQAKPSARRTTEVHPALKHHKGT